MTSFANPRPGQNLRIPTCVTVPDHALRQPWWSEDEAIRAYAYRDRRVR